MNIKKQIKVLKTIQKKVNKNMINFLRIYDHVIRMIDYGYDLFVDMDMISEASYKDLVGFVYENQIDMNFLPELVLKKWNHIINSKKLEIQNFGGANQEFDAFFWSYILVEMYIVIPYLLTELRIKLKLETNLNLNISKIKTKLANFHTPIDLFYSNIIFKKWDYLDNQASKSTLDIVAKPALCHVSYEMLHKTFSSLFNYYYLVLEEDYLSKKNVRMIYLYSKLPWFLLVVVILIIIGLAIGLSVNWQNK